MMYRKLSLILLLLGLPFASVMAQLDESYTAPRNEYGQPDLQGVWATEFVTLLERPDGVEGLIVSAEAMPLMVAAFQGNIPDNIDPDVSLQNIGTLAMVKGEYRSSILVSPEDGQLPLNDAGLEMVNWSAEREVTLFDHPEQRSRVERCLESWSFPPIRTLPVMFAHQFVQTPEHIMIGSEDSVSLRVIYMNDKKPPPAWASYQGQSLGHWEGDTLVVETANFLDDDPSRAVFGRPLVMSAGAKVMERFTRVSESELFYQFSVDDPTYYTEPWSGEFSFALDSGHTYEYSCHEGNYSTAGILRGGQMEMARLAEEAAAEN